MTRDQQVASEALFTMIAGSEPRLSMLKPWYRTLVETIDKWYKAEGNQGVTRAKEILHAGWLNILFGENPQLEFVKSTGGVPNLVVPLVERVKSLTRTPRLMSAVLSLVRITDLWSGKPDESTVLRSLTTIATPVLPRTAARVIQEFHLFLETILSTPAYDGVPFIKALRGPLVFPNEELKNVLFVRKKGPHGPLTENAHLDLVCLRRCKTSKGTRLWDEVMYLQLLECEYQEKPHLWKPSAAFTADGRPNDLEAFSDEQLLTGLAKGQKLSKCPGKLSLKYEKSGKVRVIAMPDYWTQYTLRPLGDWLRNVLRSLQSDATFDQASAIPKIVQWQKSGRTVYSFDQSSCTDLFPMDLQTVILESRFDSRLAQSVRTVLTDREWEITLPKSKVSKQLKWSVGQPLGVYASWPLMAVAHHLLVQFASWRCTPIKSRWKPFDDYVICGDDIVIGSYAVANSYLRLVKALGMKINKSKSYISGGKTGKVPTSEFAKMVVWNTNLLYPLKPKQIMASIQDWRLAVPILWELHNSKRWGLSLGKIHQLINRFYLLGSRYLKFLLTVPHNLGGCGVRDSTSLKSRFSDFIKTGSEIHPLLYYIARRIRSRLLALRGKASKEAILGAKAKRVARIPGYTLLEEEVFLLHPLRESLTYLSEKQAKLPPMLKRPVLSLEDLVVEIIVDGLDHYKSILFGQVTPGPSPWDDPDIDTRRHANTWRKVLDKPKHFAIPTSQVLASAGIRSEDEVDASAELQLQRVVEVVDMLKPLGEL